MIFIRQKITEYQTNCGKPTNTMIALDEMYSLSMLILEIQGQNLSFEGIFLIFENHPKPLDLRTRLNSKKSRTSAKTESVQTRLPDQTFKGSKFQSRTQFRLKLKKFYALLIPKDIKMMFSLKSGAKRTETIDRVSTTIE